MVKNDYSSSKRFDIRNGTLILFFYESPAIIIVNVIVINNSPASCFAISNLSQVQHPEVNGDILKSSSLHNEMNLISLKKQQNTLKFSRNKEILGASQCFPQENNTIQEKRTFLSCGNDHETR